MSELEPIELETNELGEAAPEKLPTKKTTKKTAARKTVTKTVSENSDQAPDVKPKKKAASKAKKKVAEASNDVPVAAEIGEIPTPPIVQAVLFQAPDQSVVKLDTDTDTDTDTQNEADVAVASEDDHHGAEAEEDEGTVRRRPRRRGGRRRRKGSDASDPEDDAAGDESTNHDAEIADDADPAAGESRRTRTRNRTPKNPEDEIIGVNGSTRLEAKKQRRREGREAGRRRAPIVSEAEFLARREAVDRVMVIRQWESLTQIGVLEDNVLVEHYVSRESQSSMIGNVYLGRVQNVLPSMEAAFIDIGKGRNAVLYAGEVNWAALGHIEGQPRKIESVLTSGQTLLVQVTKDPVGQKGARLTGQVSIPGRFLVYVPDGNTKGISRKLPDTERNRLKTVLKEIVPDTAGVIVRTAAEGASEEELTLDVQRLTAQWADIEVKIAEGKAPELLYGEPDLTLKVVRDLFTEDFAKLVVQGGAAWELVEQYVRHVAPDLIDRLESFEPDPDGPPAAQDLFVAYRVDEQIAKGLDRKVWLPSGGSLVIDRTEAMTVVDVNTGKFTGSGGNLEETVTKNNLEAAEEIVRQLRLRDIGGIVVIDFIDMVLESNRDLVLRRLVECLGRDRTRHQVAEVTSLGLVQMTRKRIGTGLVEAFSEECSCCKGRGLLVQHEPVATAGAAAVSDEEPRSGRRRGQRRGRQNDSPAAALPSPADLAGTRQAIEPLPMLNEVPGEAGEAGPIVEKVPPVVHARTRKRRTATRPAGPPTEEAPTIETPVDPEDPIDPEDQEDSEDHLVLPVPIKKRGARKR